MMRAITILLLGGMLSATADADRPISFLCGTELSTGFRVDKSTRQ
jgi:hypothetical protein